jgi:hypothetical protein
MARMSLTLLCALAASPGELTAYPKLAFEARTLQIGTVSLAEVSAQLDEDGRYRIEVGDAPIPGALAGIVEHSLEGRLDRLATGAEQFSIGGSYASGLLTGQFELEASAGVVTAVLSMPGLPLASLRTLESFAPIAGWLAGGTVSGGLELRSSAASPVEADCSVMLRDLGFDSPDGRYAAASLDIELSGRLMAGAEPLLEVSGSIGSGELLLDDFYRDFTGAPLQFRFEPARREDAVELRALRLGDGGAMAMEGSALVGIGAEPGIRRLTIDRLELNFPAAYARYMEPALASRTLDGLSVTGRMSWSAEWSAEEFRSGDLDISDLSVVDSSRGRFAFTGLNARLRPGDYNFDSFLQWRGLIFGRVNLGAGEAALDAEPGAVALLRPLVLEVLDGRLELSEFRLALGGDGTRGSGTEVWLKAELRDLDMKLLTEALGWPVFEGRVSGSLPGARFDDGVLEFDGGILLDVFDGQVSLRDLRIERPFGVLPSLAANVDARDLDLGLLTRTFSFGQISGRIDGYVNGLRMLDWRPVAFDAWIGTPQRQREAKDISKQAVKQLTTLGGGAATAALAGPVMRLFRSFSYRRLGLGCRLQNNVCELRGLGDDDAGIVIMEGAGIPRVTIRAFNRRVDWPQFVAELTAVSAD